MMKNDKNAKRMCRSTRSVRTIYVQCLFSLLLFVGSSLRAQDVNEGIIVLDKIAPQSAVVITATKSITMKTGFKASSVQGSFNAKIGTTNNIPPLFLVGAGSMNIPNPSNDDYNYISMIDIVACESSALGTGKAYMKSNQYFDGLGRPTQNVQLAITPDGGDITVDNIYDNAGRKMGTTLPFPIDGNFGRYDKSANGVSEFYNNDGFLLNEITLESSALDRVIGKKGPGVAWTDHGVTVSYEFNAANEVANFIMDGSNFKHDGSYPINTLDKTVTTDEDNKPTTEYKDVFGRVVMKQNGTDVATYYVYNNFDQLCYVIPPLATENFKNMPSTQLLDEGNPIVANLCYVYKYDENGNCIFKKLPGCDPIKMVYDIADRLILSQDGEQELLNQWTVNKYDALGRLVYTGVMTNTFTAEQFAATINSSLVVESYVPKSSTVTFDSIGYTDNFFTGKIKPLIVNYYDNVDFLKYLSQTEQIKFSLPTTTDYSSITKEMRGMLTGSRVYVLDGLFTHYSTRVNYYNELEMVGYTVASNHVGGYDYTKNDYNLYTGKITKTTQRHSSNFGTGENEIKEEYSYTYDNGQRLKTTIYKLNDKPAVVLAYNTYDKVGRLTEKKRHSSADTEQFEYNIRSWPTKISSGNFVENIYYNVPKTTDGKKYYNGNISYLDWTYKDNSKGYEFEYTDLNQLKSAAYKHQSSAGGDGDFDESYVYDKMGNITTLSRKSGGALVDQLTLYYQNQGKSNQLLHIDDAVVENNGQNKNSRKEYFNLHGTADTEFNYDKNGNIVIDIDRDIVAIRYNLLNLPDLIQFKNGSQIVNTYDATGIKLRTEYFTQVSIVEPVSNGQIVNKSYLIGCVDQNGTIYVDNKEYTTSNGDETLTSLERVYNSEGYVTDLINPQYYYYRRDHLGDNREVWLANTKETKQVTQYYPSGLQMASNEGDNPSLQERKYNGKEFVEMHGLDAYDYGARLLFSDRGGSWMSVDPLAEKFYDVSPYIYCHNNPINRIDPDGRSDVYNRKGVFVEHNNTEIEGKTDHIVIRDQNFVKKAFVALGLGNSNFVKKMSDNIDTRVERTTLSAEAYSNVFTNALSETKGVDMGNLYNGSVSVNVFLNKDEYNNPYLDIYQNASQGDINGQTRITATIDNSGGEYDNRYLFSTTSNVQNLLGAHEKIAHGQMGALDNSTTNNAYHYQFKHNSWKNTTEPFKSYFIDMYKYIKKIK